MDIRFVSSMSTPHPTRYLFSVTLCLSLLLFHPCVTQSLCVCLYYSSMPVLVILCLSNTLPPPVLHSYSVSASTTLPFPVLHSVSVSTTIPPHVLHSRSVSVSTTLPPHVLHNSSVSVSITLPPPVLHSVSVSTTLPSLCYTVILCLFLLLFHPYVTLCVCLYYSSIPVLHSVSVSTTLPSLCYTVILCLFLLLFHPCVTQSFCLFLLLFFVSFFCFYFYSLTFLSRLSCLFSFYAQ